MLARLTLPLADVLNFRAGSVLALPQAALDRISLEGLGGRSLAEARLGQNRGMRAIRLNAGAAGQADPVQMAATAAPEPVPMMAMGDFGGMADLGDMMFQATGTE